MGGECRCGSNQRYPRPTNIQPMNCCNCRFFHPDGARLHLFTIPWGLDHCWENEGLNGGRLEEPNKKRKTDSMHWVWQGNLVPSLPPELSQQLHAKGHPPDGTVKDTWGWGFALCNECLAGVIYGPSCFNHGVLEDLVRSQVADKVRRGCLSTVPPLRAYHNDEGQKGKGEGTTGDDAPQKGKGWNKGKGKGEKGA